MELSEIETKNIHNSYFSFYQREQSSSMTFSLYLILSYSWHKTPLIKTSHTYIINTEKIVFENVVVEGAVIMGIYSSHKSANVLF